MKAANRNKNKKVNSKKQTKKAVVQTSTRKRRHNPRVDLSLNGPQLNYTNPNVFWEVKKASTPGGVKISAKEPVGQVALSAASTGGFTLCTIGGVSSLLLNPIETLFPRLSSISLAYELFIFRKFKIDFISSQPTTSAGQMLIWADYNAADSFATTSSQALSNISSIIGNVYSCLMVRGGSEFSRLPRYNINTNVSGPIDQTIQANILCAVQGYTGASGSILGELLVEYDIEFFTPTQIAGAILRVKEIETLSNELAKVYKALPPSLARDKLNLQVNKLCEKGSARNREECFSIMKDAALLHEHVFTRDGTIEHEGGTSNGSSSEPKSATPRLIREASPRPGW